MPLTATSLCPTPGTTSIPAENPAASLIIGQEDFQRIKEAARVLTKEEREAKLTALKAEKEAILVGISPLPLLSLLADRSRAAGGGGCTQVEPTLWVRDVPAVAVPRALLRGHHLHPPFTHIFVCPWLPGQRAGETAWQCVLGLL